LCGGLLCDRRGGVQRQATPTGLSAQSHARPWDRVNAGGSYVEDLRIDDVGTSAGKKDSGPSQLRHSAKAGG